MTSVANVHIRDVPPEAVETLREFAHRRRRSLNAELVEAVVVHAERLERARDYLDRLEEVRRSWREAHPDGFPPGLEPATIIRRHRDGG